MDNREDIISFPEVGDYFHFNMRQSFNFILKITEKSHDVLKYIVVADFAFVNQDYNQYYHYKYFILLIKIGNIRKINSEEIEDIKNQWIMEKIL